jgi:uncharacterized protein YoxC
MTLDTAESAALLIIATLAIVILLRILAVVHKQNRTVKELEMRMKAMEKLDASSFEQSRTKDTKKG